jgi:putative Ca2+/H+ antiporter (TMEM165/GDT1 family)
MKRLALIFLSVFLAELGDKTQLATLLYATDKSLSAFSIFAAASAALVVSTFLAVLVGESVTRFLPVATLKTLAGLAFIAVGIWTIITAR